MNNLQEQTTSSLGTYTVQNAALYIYATNENKEEFPLTTRHLYRWTRDGLAGKYLQGIHNRHNYINFRDLISLRVIATMRAQGIKHKEIMVAQQELKRAFGWEYPFAMADFWTAKPDIMMKINGVLLSVSRHMQYAMDLINKYLTPVHGLSFDVFGMSTTWTPRKGILFDPQVQYGSPCIEGTRIPTEVLWSFNDAGDSINSLAIMYGLQPSQIERAIEWEKQLQQAAKN